MIDPLGQTSSLDTFSTVRDRRSTLWPKLEMYKFWPNSVRACPVSFTSLAAPWDTAFAARELFAREQVKETSLAQCSGLQHAGISPEHKGAKDVETEAFLDHRTLGHSSLISGPRVWSRICRPVSTCWYHRTWTQAGSEGKAQPGESMPSGTNMKDAHD